MLTACSDPNHPHYQAAHWQDRKPPYSIDLSQSVENEYLCTLIAKALGLPVPHCFIMQVGKVKALAVERFDRRYATDRS